MPQILVEGKTFHNYEGEQLGSVPFHTDFAKSCNTAFISLAPRVPGNTLPDTARALGIGACWSLGTPAFRGKVAPPKDQVDLAATSFGQGSTLVSPVSLAVMAATVARGSYIAPQLVLNGAAAAMQRRRIGCICERVSRLGGSRFVARFVGCCIGGAVDCRQRPTCRAEHAAAGWRRQSAARAHARGRHRRHRRRAGQCAGRAR